jgi:hypothetical protein
MIIIFCDFHQFFCVFLKNQCYDPLFAEFASKTPIFVENIFKIIASVLGYVFSSKA